jgi:hypothetical protein
MTLFAIPCLWLMRTREGGREPPGLEEEAEAAPMLE